MIHHPIAIILFLLVVESAVLYIADQPRFKKYFHFLPSVFWIYFLPMLASSVGLLDPHSVVYQKISAIFLPASLVLLLLSSDIKGILRLGKPALIMMFAGSLGIMVGMPLVFLLFKPWVGAHMWSGFGALSASWIGGSANMIAVKEAIGTPDSVFTPMVIVDTVVPYVWMGILVASSGFQWQFDRINESDRRILDVLARRAKVSASERKEKSTSLMTVAILLLSVAAAGVAKLIGSHLPVIKDAITPFAWTIIAASFLGILFSFSPLKKLEDAGASRVGYFLLYFVLTSIGAKANITNLHATLILIIAGFMVVLIHVTFILVAARMIRAPMFLAAVASQANIGGVASAPVVAAVYQPGLASVGLLLAILGNIVGTYLGIITAQLCRMFAG